MGPAVLPHLKRSQVEVMDENPALLLQAPALIPSDRFAADGLRGDDVFVLPS